MIYVGVVRDQTPVICKARPDRKADSFGMQDTADLEGVAELLHVYSSLALDCRFGVL
jgi:hypothetical protein